MHRGVLHCEELEEPHALVLSVVMEGEAEDVLGAMIVSPVAEHESRAALRGLDAPTRENAGDFNDVRLRQVSRLRWSADGTRCA